MKGNGCAEVFIQCGDFWRRDGHPEMHGWAVTYISCALAVVRVLYFSESDADKDIEPFLDNPENWIDIHFPDRKSRVDISSADFVSTVPHRLLPNDFDPQKYDEARSS